MDLENPEETKLEPNLTFFGQSVGILALLSQITVRVEAEPHGSDLASDEIERRVKEISHCRRHVARFNDF